ncbi:MAG: hypothetical protein IJ089_12470 [Clostridia bacterium]|nr:hypothetical protein [Clostridia bacterium]
MSQRQAGVFRQKTLDRISSPEQLTGYLRVTNPGIWIFLVAVVVLLAGFFVWAAVDTLETTEAATAIVENDMARVMPTTADVLSAGMPFRVAGQEVTLISAEKDEFGRAYGMAQVDLPDGTYEGVVVTEAVRPIQFLLLGR